ncbi:1-phosphofructokinase [Pseudoroseomonas cervicalis]|uniref:1-phosphofructokinase n=1 Tax=Teichococcus cervicalis TaxID=204525 RepID=UPI0022F1C04E|nr:1-phosphofructokinase [Pseudoroseomonas cervicalis]WBV41611.1 1-phosphofructokinase [Pseudoroseomonas cervicalis]
MPAEPAMPRIATVTLNPALDLTIPLPQLVRGSVNRAGAAELRPAGKGVNVSVMLAVLGEASRATGLLGEADLPVFEAFLAPLGIQGDFQPVPGRCRINVKLVETGAGEVTDINPPGPTVDEAALQAMLKRLAPAPRIAVLSGSLPPGLGPAALARVLARLKADGSLVVLDSSGPAFDAALAEGPALVKPNRDELSALLGRPLPDRAALLQGARELQARGIGHVVVSAGGEGALFVLPEACLWAKPPRVALTTTVGAGDAMVAGLTAALARGLDPEAMARLATGCAAAAVSRPPGGLPALAEIERLAAATHVEFL